MLDRTPHLWSFTPQYANGGVIPHRWRRDVTGRRRCRTSWNVPGLLEKTHRLTGLQRVFQRSSMETLEGLFRSRVSAFLGRSGLSPTAFGEMAVGDPNLMRQIGRGRSPSLRTADRILAFIAEQDRASGGGRDPPRRP